MQGAALETEVFRATVGFLLPPDHTLQSWPDLPPALTQSFTSWYALSLIFSAALNMLHVHKGLVHELISEEKLKVIYGRQNDATMDQRLAVLNRGAVRMKEGGSK